LKIAVQVYNLAKDSSTSYFGGEPNGRDIKGLKIIVTKRDRGVFFSGIVQRVTHRPIPEREALKTIVADREEKIILPFIFSFSPSG
jgi:hypothetical protein